MNLNNSQALSLIESRCKMLGQNPVFDQRKEDGSIEKVPALQWVKNSREALDKATPELVHRALNEARANPDRQLALNSARVLEIDNFIRATTNWGMFFNIVTLGESDWAEWENKTRYQMKIGYLSEEGEPQISRAISPHHRQMIPLAMRTTDWFEYPLVDWYRGRVADMNSANVDLAFDLQSQIDLDAFSLLTTAVGSGGALGSFTKTGNKIDRTWNAHSNIVQANLPDTNDIACATKANGGYSLADASSSTYFGLDVFREVIGYCSRFGSVLGQPLRPTGAIIVNAIDAGHLASSLDPTTIIKNEVTDALLQDWFQVDFGGIRWTIIPDVTIEQNYCYPILNQKVGELYLKPVYDASYTQTDPQKNVERRMQARLLGYAIPKAWTPRFLRVQYRTS